MVFVVYIGQCYSRLIHAQLLLFWYIFALFLLSICQVDCFFDSLINNLTTNSTKKAILTFDFSPQPDGYFEPLFNFVSLSFVDDPPQLRIRQNVPLLYLFLEHQPHEFLHDDLFLCYSEDIRDV